MVVSDVDFITKKLKLSKISDTLKSSVIEDFRQNKVFGAFVKYSPKFETSSRKKSSHIYIRAEKDKNSDEELVSLISIMSHETKHYVDRLFNSKSRLDEEIEPVTYMTGYIMGQFTRKLLKERN